MDLLLENKKNRKNQPNWAGHGGLVYVFECSKGITSMSNAQDGLKVVKTIPTEMVGELLLHHDYIYITDSKTDCVKLLHHENLEERVSIGGKGSQRNLFSCPNGIWISKMVKYTLSQENFWYRRLWSWPVQVPY